MPASFVKTKEQEKAWNKAKQLAKDQGHSKDWAYITGIYKKLINENVFKSYKKIYIEAIPLSKVRPFLKGNLSQYKDRLKDWFDGKWRVYVSLPKSKEVNEMLKSDLEKEIESELENTQYELRSFKDGILFDKKNNREVKLGKVMNRMNTSLLQRWNNSEEREGKNIQNPIIVISRHPYDILGQSFDRGWSSCKELGKGSNEKYLKDEMFQIIVAYLIYQDDKNIKKPIARLLAVPYFNNQFDLAYVVQPVVYGTSGNWGKLFFETFKKWIGEKQGEKTGIYKISPYVYKDQLQSEIKFGKEPLPDWVIESGNIPNDYENKYGQFTWKNGIWKNGIWKNGIWEYGTWKNGIWEYGTWKNGIWEYGTWKNGIWEYGTWKNGIWEDGIWKNGIWEDGIWKDGWIYDPGKKGNYQSDWNWWNGKYVRSLISPKEYFAKKNKS